ncbi:hypothetical protein I4U23_013319 [Adineta vaga]|nr:hypothetical protein I4U23_013319 [Adineta vaga]
MQSLPSHIIYSVYYRREKFWILLSFTLISIAIPIFYYDMVPSLESISSYIPMQSLNSAVGNTVQSDSTTESITTTTIETTTTITTTTTTTTTTPFEVIVVMNEQTPAYKLATKNGSKPFIDDARVMIFEVLHLFDQCRQDSSTIVVDIGAHLGDFGLYTAACGCMVYMFEIEPTFIALINISIRINAFPPTSIHLYHNIVSDVTSNSTLELDSAVDIRKNSTPPVEVPSIRLDDISWPSSIFLLKIDFDEGEMDILRSAEQLFHERRILNMILYYDSVANEIATKQEILSYIKTVLKPKYLYIFHSNGKQLYGPLNKHHLEQLATQQDEDQPLLGLFAVFDKTIRRASIPAERYDSEIFFS